MTRSAGWSSTPLASQSRSGSGCTFFTRTAQFRPLRARRLLAHTRSAASMNERDRACALDPLGQVNCRGATTALPVADAASQPSWPRFLLSAKSAYVDGPSSLSGRTIPHRRADWRSRWDGKVAMTGARGIGATIAEGSLATAPTWSPSMWSPAAENPGRNRQQLGGTATSPPTMPSTRSARPARPSPRWRVDIPGQQRPVTCDKLLANMDDALGRRPGCQSFAPLRLTEGLVGNGSIGRGW